jgi:cyclohexa-1,5-dienecarbonyl-CoA hydratase
MTERQYIKMSIENRIAVLTIDNPPANSLKGPVLADLDSAIDEAVENSEVKAIIITGAGQFMFVAGADIGEIGELLETPEKFDEVLKTAKGLFWKIEHLTKPVIVAINGMCLGGGNELAMACHMRVASDRARFGQPEINLGIIPGFGGTQRLPRLVGKGKALELLLTGDMISAQEAQRIGLVNKVVPQGEELKTAKDLAKKIVTKGAKAVQFCIEAAYEGYELPLTDGLDVEIEKFKAVAHTHDAMEGITAFLEKRQAKFEDR